MSESKSVKERSGQLARNVVLRSYLGSGAFVRAAFPVPEDTMSQARISSLDATESAVSSSAVVTLPGPSSHSEHQFAPSTHIDHVSKYVSDCNALFNFFKFFYLEVICSINQNRPYMDLIFFYIRASAASCSRVTDCSGHPTAARPGFFPQSSKGFIPSEECKLIAQSS